MIERARNRFFIPLVAFLLTVACAGSAPGDGGPAAVDTAALTQRAQEALRPLKQRLMSELTAALADSPEHALEVCHVLAPVIPAGIEADAGPAGLRLGRTSHRLRNADNAPRPWMEPLLAAYVADPSNREPRTVRIDEQTVGYVEPIVVQEMCTTCHGGEIEPSIREKIAELYPEDQATGFAAGDLRGMFWVTVPVPVD